MLSASRQTLVAAGEVRADVAEGGGAEQRVDQGVRQRVAVGVPGEAALALEDDAAQDQARCRLRRGGRRNPALRASGFLLRRGGQQSAGQREVLRRRDLEVARRTQDELNRLTEQLNQRRVVGGVDVDGAVGA